jgi:hypothetical protein
MFDRFIRLARAKKALREQRFEDALQASLDPVIAADRRAEELRRGAIDRLLARARQRLASGDMVAAKAIVDRVRAAAGNADTAEIAAAIDAAAADARTHAQAVRQRIGEVSAAVAAGDLRRAEDLMASPPALAEAEVQRWRTAVADRRRLAVDAVVQAEARLAEGGLPASLELLARAELLDRDHPRVAAARQRLAAAGAEQAAAAFGSAAAVNDLAAALARYRTWTQALPTLAVAPEVQRAAAELAGRLLLVLQQSSDLTAARELARIAEAAALPLPEPTAALVAALVACPAGAAGGPAWAALAAAAEAVAATGIAGVAAAMGGEAAAADQRLAVARSRVDCGDLDGARAAFTGLLGEASLHAVARAELDLLDRSVEDLDRRLEQARASLRAGQLRQACAQALSLAGTARVATETQQVLAEARARMGLVDRGLDEVRVALHSRASATADGVRHCLRRLEELAKVQADHAELPRVVAAVQAEIEALAICDRLSAALDRAALSEVLQAFGELLPHRERLLLPERLDARWLGLVDRLAGFADAALAAGRLDDAERCAGQFEAFGALRPEFAARAGEWRRTVAAARSAAKDLVASARERLAERNLAEAERLAEEARRRWVECPEARALVAELGVLQQQAATLDHVQAMARERDFLGAHQKLAAMPAATPFLRTRIYDMKQNLARAQGLDGAFLLRVDEGGEQLVLRGESVSIGNVRQQRADLPLLANLAGRHASIRRSMSFHGGMQDSIVAEEGEVRIAGRKVDQRHLHDGDRVLLGPALGFVYQRPTSRSLTVRLQLTGGFQVAGTDRILLLKDRGRDGRILLGPGADVHVRVARATGEVEVFANASGQLRVSCGTGTLDGVPFAGDHPLAAGQIVAAAGITFCLLPWGPSA